MQKLVCASNYFHVISTSTLFSNLPLNPYQPKPLTINEDFYILLAVRYLATELALAVETTFADCAVEVSLSEYP